MYENDGREIYGTIISGGKVTQGMFPINSGTYNTGNGRIATYFNKSYGHGAETQVEPAGVLLTGTPELPWQAANKYYVDAKIADLVNSAPETLDTLGEIAQALDLENVKKGDSLVVNRGKVPYYDVFVKKSRLDHIGIAVS